MKQQNSSVKRQNILVLVEAIDSNINGDPDAGNSPRMDPETQHGIISDVCIKRKIRDFVGMVLGNDSIYVKHRGILALEHVEAYEKTGQKPKDKSSNAQARKYLCDNRWDVRAFGALMTGGTISEESSEGEEGSNGKHKKAGNTRYDCGAVRGPVQVSPGRTFDPICPVDNAITRVALTNRTDGAGSTENEDGTLTANSGQIGHKYTVPYGLYKFTISVNPFLAKDTGYSEQDNALLLRAIVNMFENDESSARTNVSVRKVYVFTHESDLGNAPKHKLIESVNIHRKEGVEFPRQFSDYEISVATPPEGVKLEELVDGMAAPKAKAAAA